MTSVPGGIVTFEPISLIRSPSTRMIWFVAALAVVRIDQTAGANRGQLLRRGGRPAASTLRERLRGNTGNGHDGQGRRQDDALETFASLLNRGTDLMPASNLEIEPEPELLAPLRPSVRGRPNCADCRLP